MNKDLILFLGILFLFIGKPFLIFGQENNFEPGTSLVDFLQKIEEKNGIQFYFIADSLEGIWLLEVPPEDTWQTFLATQLKKHGYTISCDSLVGCFIHSGSPVKFRFSSLAYLSTSTPVADELSVSTSSNYLTTRDGYIRDTLVIGTGKHLSKSQVIFSGFIREEGSGDPVIGATLYIDELEKGTATDNKGRFKMDVPSGAYSLRISSIDKIPRQFNLYVYGDGQADIVMQSRLVNLDEVVVSANKFDRVKSTQMGIERLTAREIKEIPVVLGERDILKVAELLPGIQKSGEASAGFNVRGSPADQNLFYLNSIPIYNVNHLVGFFSAIYPETVSEFSIYKSNLPVQYGGRLASIFDISSKKGNREKFGMRGGISPVSSGMLLEHPLGKSKGSILMGGRTTYSNWLLKRVNDPDVRNSKAYFGDLLVNIDYSFREQSLLDITMYYSKDNMNYHNQVNHSYDNKGLSIAWKETLRNKNHFQSTLVFSEYDFNASNRELVYDYYEHSYSIQHYQWRSMLVLRPYTRHTLTAGIDNSIYVQSRGKHTQFQEELLVQQTDLGNEQALESALFAGDEWVATPRFSAYIGLRYNLYHYLGPGKIHLYTDDVYLTENIYDTLNYSSGQIIKSYQKPSLRASIKYQALSHLSIKLSYNQLQQNIFMLSNSQSIAPTDKWKLADYHIKPLIGNQYAAGIYINTPLQNWEFNCEVYRKEIRRLVEFRDGANLLVTELPETEILQGDLNVYGLEFMIQKNSGAISGWVNYTYTHTKVQVENENTFRRVNDGIPFPASYDKPHAVNLVGNIRFSKRLSLSTNMVYSSGRPYTAPLSVYFLNGRPVVNYSLRNEKRIPDYFRIDISLNFEGNLKKKKFAHSSWSFSVYNITGRKNAYSVYFKEEEGIIKGYKLSIFGTPIYTLTYVFKLGNYND